MEVGVSTNLLGPAWNFRHRGQLVRVPELIHASIEDAPYVVTFDVVFDDDMVPSLGRVCFEPRPDGPRLTPKSLRDPSVALGRAMRLAIQQATTPWHLDTEANTLHLAGFFAPAGIDDAVVKPRPRRRATKAEQADEARRAAEVYNAARKAGVRNLQQPVMDALSCSQATASRRIDHARRLGLIEREGDQ